ncbi:lipoxygenase family protein [Candidatus Entotheonella palauensis]|uniref:lipoxygenase family protein n=1 Tax=Candidatus Entotheonella palauensis TaxID=93172 RepID=UPI000B7FDACC|nr:lipoxygenase family protein [Candidatus Entotheonella palauensis]
MSLQDLLVQSLTSTLRCVVPNCLVPGIAYVGIPALQCAGHDTFQIDTMARALGCIPGGFWGVPKLPQNDDNPGARNREIDQTRERVQWDLDSVPGISLVKDIPVEQYPSFTWLMVGVGQSLKILLNYIDLIDSGQFTASEEACKQFTDALNESVKSIEAALARGSTRSGETADKYKILSALSDDGVFQDEAGYSIGDWLLPCTCGSSQNALPDACKQVYAPCERCTKAVINHITKVVNDVFYGLIGQILDNPGWFKKADVKIEDYNNMFRGTPTTVFVHLPWMGQKRERLALLEILIKIFNASLDKVSKISDEDITKQQTHAQANAYLETLITPVVHEVVANMDDSFDIGSLRSVLRDPEESQTPAEQLDSFFVPAVISIVKRDIANDDLDATAMLQALRSYAGQDASAMHSHDVGYNPHLLYNFEANRTFELQRTAGQNPMLLTRVTDLDDLKKKIAITDERYQEAIAHIDGNEDRYWSACTDRLRTLNEFLVNDCQLLREEFFNPPFGNDTLDRAFNEKRLFTVDFPQLGDVTASLGPFGEPRYLYQPIGLFALPPKEDLQPGQRDRREVAAIALQSKVGVNDPDVPIVLPTNGYTWRALRSIFQQADSMESEYPEHLGLCHMMMETFQVAMRRTMATNHPLYRLLTPHFDNTITTNHIAVSSMLESRGLTQGLQSLSTIDSCRLAAKAVHDADISTLTVWDRLVKQGTDDPEILPNYPYRDDAMRIWNAIEDWVTSYVDIFYKTDTDVLDDYELQNWVHELQLPSGGNLHGIGTDGFIQNKKELINLVSVIMFHGSAEHALTNFPLGQVQMYAPCMPMSIYRPAPTRNDEVKTREDWLAYLPPLQVAVLQLTLGFIVGTTHYTRLGFYMSDNFGDTPEVAEKLRAFNSRLREIESEISSDNKVRPMPYIYLLPSRIPQSVNI